MMNTTTTQALVNNKAAQRKERYQQLLKQGTDPALAYVRSAPGYQAPVLPDIRITETTGHQKIYFNDGTGRRERKVCVLMDNVSSDIPAKQRKAWYMQAITAGAKLGTDAGLLPIKFTTLCAQTQDYLSAKGKTYKDFLYYMHNLVLKNADMVIIVASSPYQQVVTSSLKEETGTDKEPVCITSTVQELIDRAVKFQEVRPELAKTQLYYSYRDSELTHAVTETDLYFQEQRELREQFDLLLDTPWTWANGFTLRKAVKDYGFERLIEKVKAILNKYQEDGEVLDLESYRILPELKQGSWDFYNRYTTVATEGATGYSNNHVQGTSERIRVKYTLTQTNLDILTQYMTLSFLAEHKDVEEFQPMRKVPSLDLIYTGGVHEYPEDEVPYSGIVTRVTESTALEVPYPAVAQQPLDFIEILEDLRSMNDSTGASSWYANALVMLSNTPAEDLADWYSSLIDSLVDAGILTEKEGILRQWELDEALYVDAYYAKGVSYSAIMSASQLPEVTPHHWYLTRIQELPKYIATRTKR